MQLPHRQAARWWQVQESVRVGMVGSRSGLVGGWWGVGGFVGSWARGYNKEDVRQLFDFIDWIMKLPEELASQLKERIIEYEEGCAQKMPYVTSIERMGIEQGLLIKAREAILNVLQARFRNISLPESLVQMIQGIDKEDMLDTLHQESIMVDSIPTFEQKVAQIASKNGSE